MRIASVLAVTAIAASACLFAQSANSPIVWAPKPTVLPRYVAPQRPLTKLSELRATHKALKNWSQVIVDDDHLHAEYISMAPGGKTEPRMHADTREWWVVTDGQIRFHIDGQEPFVASKGWLVQVPYRTIYSLETVGDQPSLRFEVNIAHAKYLYPRAEEPPKTPGYNWLLVRLPQPRGAYDRGNKPYIDFNAVADKFEQQPKKAGQVRFINDNRAVSNVIYGHAKDLPPLNPADKGHYHAECAEFWVILRGQMDYKIEGQPELIANEGDIVYAPKMTWHRPRFYGDGPACRLAMNGYPEIGHLFEAEPDTATTQTTQR